MTTLTNDDWLLRRIAYLETENQRLREYLDRISNADASAEDLQKLARYALDATSKERV